MNRTQIRIGWGLLLLVGSLSAWGQWLLVPMDQEQTDHLRAYGLTYWTLQEPRAYRAEWLLNYRGGAFLLEDHPDVRRRALTMGVRVVPITDADLQAIRRIMEDANMDNVILEKAPKIAVYAPPDDTIFRDQWDDAVKLALDYAEIPYDILWDEEVLRGDLQRQEYDWLHLHHEDFTGQFGKFYGSYAGTAWYQQRVRAFREEARQLGFQRVADLKGAVALKIREYVENGGFLFAMCSAPETIDIALATQGGRVDIVAPELDGTPIDPNYAQKLDFSLTFAFENFTLIPDPMVYEFSNIDNPQPALTDDGSEDFELFQFSAKYDPIPTMLTQCHVARVRGFLGQTTSFRRSLIKKNVVILGEIRGTPYVKYIHGKLGRGTFTFLAGHDPEDYRHNVGELPTQLELFKNSPGYRLILNNVLFPAAKERPQKT
ncbi:MAG: hypothetical protein KatS3mg115_1877 [Candidatus Poribacteria bacterium]|nr:MAG: hypothetical protein KatS3mg115_1877 [Candidatus Poribacteria bacterium]